MHFWGLKCFPALNLTSCLISEYVIKTKSSIETKILSVLLSKHNPIQRITCKLEKLWKRYTPVSKIVYALGQLDLMWCS